MSYMPAPAPRICEARDKAQTGVTHDPSEHLVVTGNPHCSHGPARPCGWLPDVTPEARSLRDCALPGPPVGPGGRSNPLGGEQGSAFTAGALPGLSGLNPPHRSHQAVLGNWKEGRGFHTSHPLHPLQNS